MVLFLICKLILHFKVNFMNQIRVALFFVLAFTLYWPAVHAQESDTSGTVEQPYIYRPSVFRTIVADSTEQNTDSVMNEIGQGIDSTYFFQQQAIDSALRAAFVKDSLLKRQAEIDSLQNLQRELPLLVKASLYTFTDNLIVADGQANIQGDTSLTDYCATVLPFRFSDPFQPWKLVVPLSEGVQISSGNQPFKIKSLKTPDFQHFYSYNPNDKVVVIRQQAVLARHNDANYFKSPVDSVFLNERHQLVKVKRYFEVYAASSSFQREAFLFNQLWQVKQYIYSGNELASYELVKLCERWSAKEEEKVCLITSYTVKKTGYAYELVRSNNPPNEYTEGTYTYDFDDAGNLRAGSFRSNSGAENWKTFVELNEEGNVSRYVYQDKGEVSQTLLINYTPGAPEKVEIISCTFEDDGVSYYQHNTTTGKGRTRDRLTMEWGPWE